VNPSNSDIQREWLNHFERENAKVSHYFSGVFRPGHIPSRDEWIAAANQADTFDQAFQDFYEPSARYFWNQGQQELWNRLSQFRSEMREMRRICSEAVQNSLRTDQEIARIVSDANQFVASTIREATAERQKAYQQLNDLWHENTFRPPLLVPLRRVCPYCGHDHGPHWPYAHCVRCRRAW